MVEGLDGYSGISLEEGESRSSDSLLAGRVKEERWSMTK